MVPQKDILNIIRKRATQRVLFTQHAIRQISRPDRMISTSEIRNAILTGEIIEDYPEDQRGHSCLIFGKGDEDRPIHVLCSPKDEYLAIVTAYLPAPEEWSQNFKVRKR